MLYPASASLPSNVKSPEPLYLDCSLESNYWRDVITELIQLMGYKFHEFNIVVFSLSTGEAPQPFEGNPQKTVLIVHSDNSGLHYEKHFKKYRAVFKVHLNKELDNIYPVPLGCTNNCLINSNGNIRNKTDNVFFSGNINNSRIDLWRALAFKHTIYKPNIKNFHYRRFLLAIARYIYPTTNFSNAFPHSYICFTKSFGSGLNPNEYTKHLEACKIALSPKGFWRSECFRHFEAMKAGCTIISDKLPDTWYFRNSPIIQINQWSQLKHIVNSLIRNNLELQDLSIQTLLWWNNVCSPKAVSQYMAEKL